MLIIYESFPYERERDLGLTAFLAQKQAIYAMKMKYKMALKMWMTKDDR